jgi:aspartate aminotransferase
VDALQSIPGVECFTPDGAFYVLPKVSALYGKSATIDGKTYKINTCDDLVMYLLGVHFTGAAIFTATGPSFGILIRYSGVRG